MSDTEKNKGLPKETVKLETEEVVKPRGKIEATLKKEIEYPENPGRAFYLPEGEVLEVPQDTAYYIKGEAGWYYAQFFEPGRMTGPVVYVEAEIQSANEAYRKNSNWISNLVIGIMFTCIGVILCPLLLNTFLRTFEFSDIPPFLFLSIIVITLMFLLKLFLGVWMTCTSLLGCISRRYAVRELKNMGRKSSPYIAAAQPFDA